MRSRDFAATLLAGLTILCIRAGVSADSVYVTTYSDLVSAAVNAPAGGRTITVKKGIYYQNNVIWPVGKSNLTIQGETSDPNDTVLVGMGIDNANQNHNIGIDGCPHFTLQNMTLKNSYYHAIQVNTNSHYPIIRNCILWDNGEAAVKSTSDGTSYSDYGLVENCRIGFTTNGHRSVIEGVDLIAAKGWVIRNNSFVNVHGVGSVAYGAYGKGNSQDTIIENNLFYNCDIAASFGDGGTGLQYFRDGDTRYEHQNGFIRNNVMIGGSDAAVYVAWSRNAKIYNNLSYKHVLTFQARWNTTDACFRNNIAVVSPSNPGEPIIRWRDSAVDAGSSNNVYGYDSWFVAPAIAETGNFHLLASAIGAINTGYALPVDVPADKDGVARPQGAGWDLGPYEYVAPNRAPTVSAGADIAAVYENRPVALHATASDPDGDPLTYGWTQIGGKPVILGGAATAAASLTTPTVGSLTEASLVFQITVSDGKGGTAGSTVTVHVCMAGDFTHDNSVNVSDLQGLVAAWGTQGTPAGSMWNPADFNNDGYINVGDLQILVANWGRSLN